VSLSVSATLHQLTFFQTVLDSLVDGVAIFSDRGELVHANQRACSLCEQFSLNSTQSCTIPEAIWRICQTLIDGRQLFPNQPLALESEVVVPDSTVVRLRGRWFCWTDSESPYLLVTLEDRRQSLQQQAIADAQKYGLTPREAEVWSLRCARYSYKDIAAKLYISENTVKKHLKNVNVKRQTAF
jgi:DNA-binding CsgD family transcriptional regulator